MLKMVYNKKVALADTTVFQQCKIDPLLEAPASVYFLLLSISAISEVTSWNKIQPGKILNRIAQNAS